MSKAFAMILAGGASESLSVLTEARAEPALPFAGKYRIIDFVLSNLVNSDIYNVAVLTQYRPRSLNAHIGTGKPWDLDLATGGVALLQPFRGGPLGDWQKGTADAVRRNLEFIEQQTEDHVLILPGDHIYLMDYRPMLKAHAQSGADVTIAVRRVNPHETHRFGIISVGSDNRIKAIQEKPRRTRETLASMGIYIFRKEVLMQVLTETDGIDFARDVLPRMLADKRQMMAHHFLGYWEDVGTVQSYWEANMSLLAEDPALDLYDHQWVVHTRSEEKAPVRLGSNAVVDGTLISNGCVVLGEVQRSVLSPGVFIDEGAVVKDSIVFNGARIEAGARVDRAIIDKNAVIRAGAIVGHGDDNTPQRELPERLNTGVTLVGRNAEVPEKMVLGRNVVVHPFSGADAYGRKKKIQSGASVGQNRR